MRGRKRHRKKAARKRAGSFWPAPLGADFIFQLLDDKMASAYKAMSEAISPQPGVWELAEHPEAIQRIEDIQNQE